MIANQHTGLSGISPAMLDTLAAQGLRELAHAPIAKVARALAHFDREQLGIAIEVMVAMLDASDGDPDAEEDDPAEANGDEKDISWIDSIDRRGNVMTAGSNHEDDEEDDHSGTYADEDQPGGWMQSRYA